MVYINIETKDWNFFNHFCCYGMKFEYVDFNILYHGKELERFLATHKENFIGIEKTRNQKQYYTGEYLRFKLNKYYIDFIYDFNIKNFQTTPITDPCFYNELGEVISVINHENVIIINEKYVDINIFKDAGFDVSCTFGGYFN